MSRFVDWNVKAARGVVAVAVVVMAVGVWQLRTAKVDALPEFTPPTVEVQTEALGLSAEEVEQLITVPLEQDLLAGVAWLDTIGSESVPGLSSVHLVFKPGTNLYRARQVVQERISQAAGLPNVSRQPQMLQPESSTGRVAMVALSSPRLSPIQIGVLARWTIRPRLLAVPGVANVAIWGQRERQLQVQVDPQKLRDHNVSLERVISTTGNALWVSPLTFLEASTPGTGGFIDTPTQRLGVQHNLPILEPGDLAKVVIDDSAGTSLTLGDVASVVEDHQPLIGDAIVDGRGSPGSLLVIDKLPDANTDEVAQGVQEALDGLGPGLAGLTMDSSIFRPATYVNRSVHNLGRTLIVAGALLLIALGALLYDWRKVLVAAVAVSLPLVVAAAVLHQFGVTFNIVVFAGLAMAVGAVANDAIHVVQDTGRRRHELAALSAQDAPPASVPVREVASAAGRSILWATVIFAAALTPIFFMHDTSGDAFFPPMAAACLLALVASLVVTVTVTPALSHLLLAKAPIRGESPVARLLQRGYRRLLAPATRTPIPAVVAVVVATVGAVVVLPRLDAALLPGLKDPNLLIDWRAAPGTALGEMDRVTGRATQEIREIPGVKAAVTQVGQASLGDQSVGSDAAQTWIRLENDAVYDETVARIDAAAGGYPGLHHELVSYTKDKMNEVLSQTGDQITVRLFGNDLSVLHAKADEVKAAISDIDGVVNGRVAARDSEPAIEVQVDLAKARQAGIKPGTVRRTAATLLSGVRVGSLFEDQKVFDVQVWSTPDSRLSVGSVEDLFVDTPQGPPVRLGDVATVRVRPSEPVIRHEDISRYVDVAANVRGRNVGAVADAVASRLRQVDFPLEYHAELVGDYSDQQAAQRRLAGFAVAAAVAIFLLLQAAFRSWRLAVMSVALLPVALAGGVIVAWAGGDALTLATVAGLLAVLAIALRQSISLLDRFRRLRAAGDVPFGPDLVDRGASEQVAPTVLTAVAIVAVFVPFFVFGDIAGLEVVRPMAAVVVGGLVTSAVATLLLLPALYLRFGPHEEPELFAPGEELHAADREPAGGMA